MGQKKNIAVCHSRKLRRASYYGGGNSGRKLAAGVCEPFISGCFSGSLAVTQSAIADVSDEKTRPKNFGLLGAAFGVSLFIGPALGGFLSDPGVHAGFTFATPFWLAAFLTGINFLQVVWLF